MYIYYTFRSVRFTRLTVNMFTHAHIAISHRHFISSKQKNDSGDGTGNDDDDDEKEAKCEELTKQHGECFRQE